MPSKLIRRYGRKKKRHTDSGSGGSHKPKPNPSHIGEIVETLIPGFAGFAAARFTTYVVTTQTAKYKPTWGKHAGAVAAIAAFAAAWLGSHRIKALEKYHLAISVGAGIAAIQSIIQMYIPSLGWMLSDPTSELATTSAPTPAQVSAGSPAPTSGFQLPMGFAPVDDPQNYVYNDSYDSGRLDQQQAKADVRAETKMAQDATDSISIDDADLDGLIDQQMAH